MSSLEADDRPVYITGTFNDWDPLGNEYQMKKVGDHYTIELTLPSDARFEFKFTRGGWENVEIDRYGNITENRSARPSQKRISETVERWRIDWSPFKEEYFPIIKKVSDNFLIPQLNKRRRVWALLPYNYDRSKKSYPVLYLQDAQNLFNEGSEYGNWEIDKKLSILAEYGRGDVIVIAVEHGEKDRAKEYLLGKNRVLEGVHGKKMLRFMADTLKPYIDQNFRTRPGRKSTGIGGSSLGGLISIYAGLLYPEVYSKLMIFSPSIWAADPLDVSLLSSIEKFQSKVYLYAGDAESENLVKHVNKFAKKIQHHAAANRLDIEVKKRIRPGGTHSEFYWAQEFPRALEWLYFDDPGNPLEIGKTDKT